MIKWLIVRYDSGLKHPTGLQSKLQVGFLESGCGWLPYWLWWLDKEYKNLH
ncbi:hypothetical protein [Okeania sp. KiyG1]|uniref:hypothetical protein n=1 Tax=Okeania sp. KiyG1 TaxID=2720165 RepID=UPI001920DDB0|nr:hypothetical protein [Okeania sp. KiyG1]